MMQPGRKYSTGSSYRYGFNGKENDPETETQDYGMRIYNSRLGKFLSSDPLSKSYPWLTPYQFSSNRPIDGVDLDGLEYLRYTLIFEASESGPAKLISAYFVWNDANQHNAHGKLGRGVQYDIKMYNRKTNTYTIMYSPFVARQSSLLCGLIPTDYGNYMGATSLYEVGENGKYSDLTFSKKYDYSLPGVDKVDDLARTHDIGYDKLDAVGKESLMNDWGTTPVDEAALNGWMDIIFKNVDYRKTIDPLNHKPVNKDEYDAAQNAAVLFTVTVRNKKKHISSFMKDNYSKESTNNIESNYNLFLSKYMHKDKDGNWKRNEKMWTGKKNVDGTTSYTPNKPKTP